MCCAWRWNGTGRFVSSVCLLQTLPFVHLKQLIKHAVNQRSIVLAYVVNPLCHREQEARRSLRVPRRQVAVQGVGLERRPGGDLRK